jgi:hypothetical protein
VGIHILGALQLTWCFCTWTGCFHSALNIPPSPSPSILASDSCRCGGLLIPRPSSQHATTLPVPSILAGTLGDVGHPPPQEVFLKTMGGGAIQSGLLHLGQSFLCGPVGPAHGLDRAWLRHLSPLALRIASHHALHPGPGALGNMTTSSQGGFLSRPWVAALSGAVCSASVSHLCAGQLALHMASTVCSCGASAASPSTRDHCPKPRPHRAANLPAPPKEHSWPCTWPRLCAVVVPWPPHPPTSESRPAPLGPFKRVPSIPALGTLDDATTSFQGGSPSQDHEWRPSRVTRSPSVGRLCVGQLALHMASTMCGCGTSATLPSTQDRCPNLRPCRPANPLAPPEEHPPQDDG